MEEYRSLLLAIYQEACRHIEITRSTTTITSLLTSHLPLSEVIVQRIDREKSCLDTVAVGTAHGGVPLPEGRIDCPESKMKTLLAWCQQGKIAHGQRDDLGEAPLSIVIPTGVSGEVLVGPLAPPTDGKADTCLPCGALLLVAASGARFESQHLGLVQMLLEPFAIALENDLRLRETIALREAAEAEKRSLLARLGRKSLGDTVVGSESGLRAVMDRVELVARSDVPVLIVGETGTGKELVARLIHNRSPRHGGPFIRVNCGAIPPELIDSQLFGHERGAFTGAVEMRQGWFERADGGTLLLDEMGELPLAAQVRLLRILQDGWLERVGGHETINVDVRIVAATHRDLAAMVGQGNFREDLWYRIAVFPILLPPLRERKEDIAALAAHFAERAATRFGLPLAMPTEEDIRLLTGYRWPGNIRELAAVIDRAAIVGNGKKLEVATALGITPSPQPSSAPTQPEVPAASPRPRSASDILPLDVVVRQHIEAALTIAQGQVEGRHGAATMLKINPHTLRARMRKMGIDWTQFRPPEPSENP